jgi:hypothetical protein
MYIIIVLMNGGRIIILVLFVMKFVVNLISIAGLELL